MRKPRGTKKQKPITSRHCGRCRRGLTNEDSMARGYGRTCWQKLGGRGNQKNCSIEGALPKTISDITVAGDSFAMMTRKILSAVGDEKCRCGEPLAHGKVGSYDHEGGILIPGYGQKQWVYLQCSKCRYALGLNHIKIPTEPGAVECQKVEC